MYNLFISQQTIAKEVSLLSLIMRKIFMDLNKKKLWINLAIDHLINTIRIMDKL